MAKGRWVIGLALALATSVAGVAAETVTTRSAFYSGNSLLENSMPPFQVELCPIAPTLAAAIGDTIWEVVTSHPYTAMKEQNRH